MKIKLPLIILITASAAFIAIKKIKDNKFHIKSYDGKFSMLFSKDWKLSENKNELNENSNLEAINNKKGVCIIMFSKSKNELGNITLEEYNNIILSSIEGENIISLKNIKFNNKEIYSAQFNSYYKNMPVNYILYALETENYYHQFMAALIGGSKKNKYLNNILSTIKELQSKNK
ncbi:hypothetical protein [uncultured Brachyspira sp.]|uniref:hypothetical protein n=1 Tax=uncultured Brachyspira sp. TaxID=221953 RepID=UPI0025ECA044|nr:hypothetical protein [uncultured Brachyspira sp.]